MNPREQQIVCVDERAVARDAEWKVSCYGPVLRGRQSSATLFAF